MPQARLTDVNTAAITYRREAINSWKSENYSSCLGSIYALNALLPEEGGYRVIMNTEQYNEKTSLHTTAVCRHCNKEFERSELRPMTVLISDIVLQLAGGTKTLEVWECPKCHKDNELSKTELTKEVSLEPAFVRCVPDPPRRQDGLLDQVDFHRTFSAWFWMCLSEIEGAFAKFRDDNWTKMEQANPQVDYSGDLEKE